MAEAAQPASDRVGADGKGRGPAASRDATVAAPTAAATVAAAVPNARKARGLLVECDTCTQQMPQGYSMKVAIGKA